LSQAVVMMSRSLITLLHTEHCDSSLLKIVRWEQLWEHLKKVGIGFGWECFPQVISQPGQSLLGQSNGGAFLISTKAALRGYGSIIVL
jgi:hypothetical protein